MVDDPHSPTVVASVPSDVEAGTLVSVLDSHGIEARATGGFTAGFRAEAPGTVQVIVRREDEPQARAVLAEIQQQKAQIDWSQVDVGDPEEA